MSQTLTPSSIASPRTAQLSRWRSHSRGTSRGPISPRTTPSVANEAAYASIRGSRADGNTPRADSGVAGSAGGVSRETMIRPSTREHDDETTRLGAFRLGLAATSGNGVVDDLALEGGHLGEADRLAGLPPQRPRLLGQLDQC